MRIIAISSSYYQRGVAPISNVAHYLQRFVASIPPVDLMIEAASFHLSTGPTRPTLGPLRDRFESDYQRLPRLRYFRNANRITLDYPSTLPPDVALAFGKTQPQTSRVVLGELRAAIEAAFWSSRLIRVIDLPALHNGLAQAVDQLPHGEEAVNRLIDEIGAEMEAIRLQPMTMDRLPVDWTQFHPSARTILNNPFFWDQANDDAPHGNDTGADLLTAFRRWRARNQTTSPLEFLDLLLKEWGLLHDEQTLVEAEIGLAFAQIKLEGRCDPDVAARALAAIDRRVSDVATDAARGARFRLLRERVLLLTGHGCAE